MAKCVRKNCCEPLFQKPEAKSKRLCEKHYLRFCQLSERKKNDLVYRINKAIPRKTKRPKNRKFIYPKKAPRQYVSKAYEKSEICKLKYPYSFYLKLKQIRKTRAWHNLDARVRRAAASGKQNVRLDDVRELYELYSWIDTCKKYKVFPSLNLVTGNADIPLNILSFPSEGNNFLLPDMLIVAPAFLKNKYKIEEMKENAEVSEVSETATKTQGEMSLFNFLVNKYNLTRVCRMMELFSINYRYHPMQFKGAERKFPQSRPVLFNIFICEMRRLHIPHIAEQLVKVQGKYVGFVIFLEFLAIYLTLRILRSGIRRAFMALPFSVSFDGLIDFPVIESSLISELRLNNRKDLIAFYNNIFSEPVCIYSEERETLQWQGGKAEDFNLLYKKMDEISGRCSQSW